MAPHTHSKRTTRALQLATSALHTRDSIKCIRFCVRARSSRAFKLTPQRPLVRLNRRPLTLIMSGARSIHNAPAGRLVCSIMRDTQRPAQSSFISISVARKLPVEKAAAAAAKRRDHICSPLAASLVRLVRLTGVSVKLGREQIVQRSCVAHIHARLMDKPRCSLCARATSLNYSRARARALSALLGAPMAPISEPHARRSQPLILCRAVGAVGAVGAMCTCANNNNNNNCRSATDAKPRAAHCCCGCVAPVALCGARRKPNRIACAPELLYRDDHDRCGGAEFSHVICAARLPRSRRCRRRSILNSLQTRAPTNLHRP